MPFILITIVTFAVTFLLNPLSKKVAKRVRGKRHPRFHIHHSATGLLILVLGLAIHERIIAGLGLGIYLAHVAEEIYFNKKNVAKAFFILVTR